MSQTPVLNYCLQGLDFSNSSGSKSGFIFSDLLGLLGVWLLFCCCFVRCGGGGGQYFF